MSFFDKLKDIGLEKALKVTTKALGVIGMLTKSATAKNAADMITAISHVYNVVSDVETKRLTPEEAFDALDKLEKGIKENDAKADSALDEKFGGSN